MRLTAIADSSALLATLQPSQPWNRECLAVFHRRDLDVVIPALVVAEVAYLTDQRLGPRAEAAFVRSLVGVAVEAPLPEEWPVIADLVQRYSELRIGTTDAATAVLAERLGTDRIITLDRRHFGVIRSPGGRPFRILPEARAINEEPAPYGDAGEPASQSGAAPA